MKFLADLVFQKQTIVKHQANLDKGLFVLHRNLRTYIRIGNKYDWFPGAEKNWKNCIKFLIARLFFSVWSNQQGGEL